MRTPSPEEGLLLRVTSTPNPTLCPQPVLRGPGFLLLEGTSWKGVRELESLEHCDNRPLQLRAVPTNLGRGFQHSCWEQDLPPPSGTASCSSLSFLELRLQAPTPLCTPPRALCFPALSPFPSMTQGWDEACLVTGTVLVGGV